jgi:PAS domain-containing protein
MEQNNLQTLRHLTEVLTNGIDEIRMKSELLALLFNAVPVGLFIVGESPTYKILAANKKIVSLLEYDAENELIGLTPKDITKPGDIGSNVDDLKNLYIAARTGTTLIKTYITKTGKELKAKITLYHLFNSMGIVSRTIVMVETI